MAQSIFNVYSILFYCSVATLIKKRNRSTIDIVKTLDYFFKFIKNSVIIRNGLFIAFEWWHYSSALSWQTLEMLALLSPSLGTSGRIP